MKLWRAYLIGAVIYATIIMIMLGCIYILSLASGTC